MSRLKLVFLGLLGAVFFLTGLYYRLYDPAKGISFEYLGIGTWLSGLIFYTLFPKYKEITSFILGLAILHSGVVLLLVEDLANIKLLGLLVFSAGILVVLNSGFSEHLKRRKA